MSPAATLNNVPREETTLPRMRRQKSSPVKGGFLEASMTISLGGPTAPAGAARRTVPRLSMPAPVGGLVRKATIHQSGPALAARTPGVGSNRCCMFLRCKLGGPSPGARQQRTKSPGGRRGVNP